MFTKGAQGSCLQFSVLGLRVLRVQCSGFRVLGSAQKAK